MNCSALLKRIEVWAGEKLCRERDSGAIVNQLQQIGTKLQECQRWVKEVQRQTGD